ncbi:MAG: response regulator [Paracoccaceae bacterium]
MPDDLETFIMVQQPTAERPLLGLTVLVVEDSRFACEAMRLLCLRSGARIRRAGSLAAARRHLRVYRPSVVIVDLGLPDGSGADLIAELARAQPRVDALIGISGDSDAELRALGAGADAFLEKPIAGLDEFQSAVLRLLPPESQPKGPRALLNEMVTPDPMALQDDLSHVADILTTQSDEDMLDYIAQFLEGVARSAGDAPLAQAAHDLALNRGAGAPYQSDLARVAGLVQQRLENRAAM